ncbi:MAG TPA: hypothetical protein VGK94_09480 [Candidatus Polarisedimenticolia bacterium]|jgi:hypothetical protein
MLRTIFRHIARPCILRGFTAAAALLVAAVIAPGLAEAQTCHVPDNGTGTVTLPPAGCGYVSPTALHMMIDGLPPGTTIQISAEHFEFFAITTTPSCGSLGGNCEQFSSQLTLAMKGTGGLAGYNRVISMPVGATTHTAPRTPGTPVQSFDTEMFQVQGQIPPGDPDFDLLRITAGTGFGMPSPGHTTLTRLAGGDFNVDSFFDITYRIDFIGAPGGPFAGMSGSTTGTIRMKSGIPYTPPDPCVVPDAGGTVSLPPAGCGYVSPADVHMIIAGLPPGTSIEIGAAHNRFFGVTTSPGGSLGGEVEQFSSGLDLRLRGTGGLAGYTRMVTIPMQTETHVGPRTPGTSPQSFDTDMARLQGQLPPGDPDFDLLRITAGTAFGMPSPGHTTLAQLPGGNWAVDSFFDIEYRIDFVGHPGGPLGGMSGSTTATIRMNSGPTITPPPPCVVPDAGGTVALPPQGCGYVSPADLHEIINGLPAGTTIQIGAQHERFFNTTTTPGGSLGGEIEQFSSSLTLQLNGTGGMSGYMRNVTLPVQSETHVGPRTPGDPVQSFDTSMFRLQGQLPPGDPDFDLLRVTAGNFFGMPSPGHTTLTQLPGGNWAVDSFFDITYRIDFVGAPGGPFSGMSGSTTATIRMQAGQPLGPCGPIPAGDDVFPSTAKLVVEPLDPMGAPSGPPVVLRASSADMPGTMVHRQMQMGTTIPTEMLSLELRGSHPLTGGEFMIRESPTLQSTGTLQNVAQNPADCSLSGADSFFDVFTEVDLPALGETWVNTDPLALRTHIDTLPPRNARYENPFVRPVVLYDRATGQPRAIVYYELHHVDPPFPPPGRDCFSTDIDLDLTTPFGQTTANASGPTMVDRQNMAIPRVCSISGGPCVTDADCPQAGDSCVGQISTELAEMTLTGNHPTMGPLRVRESPTLPSMGNSRSQQSSQTYRADSFFDVFVEVDLPAFGMTLHNQDPVPLMAVDSNAPGITNIPPSPGTDFQTRQPAAPVLLYDQDGNPFGQINRVDHRLGPPASWQPPPPPDEYCFESWIVLNVEIFATGCTETIMLPGNFRILRGGPTDPGDGRDVMKTLMAHALLNGNSQCLGGAMSLALSGSYSSAGEIRSLAAAENEPYDSFFDVFTELTAAGVPGSIQVGPVHMSTTINTLPPEDGEIYYGPGTVIPLTDGSGTVIGQIEEVKHEVHRRLQPCPCDIQASMDALNQTTFSMLSPGTGAGAKYDWIRLRRSGPGAFVPDRIMCDGSETYSDPDTPPPGQMFFILSRDKFAGAAGTYDDCDPGPIGWDAFLASICSP